MATISEALATALKHHQAGDLERAERIYREILQQSPEHPVALHFLGVIVHQVGRHQEAVEYIHQALEINPKDGAAHSNLGNALQALGKLDEAVASYGNALQLNPNDPIAHNNLGNTLLGLKKFDEAVASFERALEIQPKYAEAHSNLGNALRRQGNLDEAVASYERALQIKPDYAGAHINLGNALRERRDLDGAITSFRRALDFQSDYAEAYNNLGLALGDLGSHEEAVASFRRALDIKPDYAEAHNNLGTVLREQGRILEAMGCYAKSLELNSDNVETYLNLGTALRGQGMLPEAEAVFLQALRMRPDSFEANNNYGNVQRDLENLEGAIASFRQALEFRPESAVTHANLGNALREQGKLDEAVASYERAVEIEPDQPLRRLQIATLCSTVFETQGAIEQYRQRLLSEIRNLSATDLRCNLPELPALGGVPPYWLPFHGYDDRPIKEAYADLFRDAFPQKTPTPRRKGPLRIGLVVTRNHEGIFLRCMKGILTRMNHELFELVVVCTLAGHTKVRAEIQDDSIRTLVVPDRLDRMAETIRASSFDLLYYWEVGTDPVNYFLPFFRLAPLQCTSWGFPVTSGIPQMDYYLSSDLVEGDGAEEHYSERLLCAGTLMTFQSRVELPDPPKPREDYGFTPNQHLYLFAQQLGKCHPAFDPILGGILRRDELGVIVLIEDRYGYAARELEKRFAATLTDVAGRIVFLPRQSYTDYICLMAVADVLLDPLHYGGGITNYDAFSLDKPIVTWPSRFSRGRYTFGCYQKMGITECVASDLNEYVDIAVTLATDADYRTSVEQRIRESAGRLFEDMDAVREHERLFKKLAEEGRSRPLS